MKTLFIAVLILLAVGAMRFAVAQGPPPPGPQPGPPPAQDQAMRDQFLNQWFDRVDTNHDGKITKQEWVKFQEQRFDELDTKKDGALTKEELKADMDKMRQRAQERREQKP